MKTKKIPNAIILPLFMIGLIYVTFYSGLLEMIIRIGFCIVVFLVFLIPYTMKIIGAGDIKLLMVLSIWVGIENSLWIIGTSMLMLVFLSLYYMVKKGGIIKRIRQQIDYIRHLVMVGEVIPINKEIMDGYPFAIVITLSYWFVVICNISEVVSYH